MTLSRRKVWKVSQHETQSQETPKAQGPLTLCFRSFAMKQLESHVRTRSHQMRAKTSPAQNICNKYVI